MQATGLLRRNLDNAKASLEVLLADLQFLRDQVTITQVMSFNESVSDHLGLLCIEACYISCNC